MEALVRVVCIIFGLVDLISFIWFYGDSAITAQLFLVLSEFFCVIYIEPLKKKLWFLHLSAAVFLTGFAANAYSLYLGTMHVYGVDWFVVLVRSILLYSFAFLSFRNWRTIGTDTGKQMGRNDTGSASQ